MKVRWPGVALVCPVGDRLCSRTRVTSFSLSLPAISLFNLKLLGKIDAQGVGQSRSADTSDIKIGTAQIDRICREDSGD